MLEITVRDTATDVTETYTCESIGASLVTRTNPGNIEAQLLLQGQMNEISAAYIFANMDDLELDVLLKRPKVIPLLHRLRALAKDKQQERMHEALNNMSEDELTEHALVMLRMRLGKDVSEMDANPFAREQSATISIDLDEIPDNIRERIMNKLADD